MIFKEVLSLSLALTLALTLVLTPSKQAKADGLAIMFCQPPNSIPIPCLADSSGRLYSYLDPAAGASNLSYYSSTTLESGTGFSSAAKKTFNGVVVTTTTIPIYLMVFDAATAPVDGAVTPKLCVYMSAGVTSAINFPLLTTSGISLSASSTGCLTKTASATVTMYISYTN